MGTLAKLAAVATIGALFVAVLSLLVDFPKLRLSGEDPTPAESAPSQGAPLPVRPLGEARSSQPQAPGFTKPEADRGEEVPQQNQSNPKGGVRFTEDPMTRQEEAHPTLPIEFTLDNGEQEVFLGGRAAVAIEFSRLGEMELATLRIHTDGSTKNHALLGPGGRFELAAGGKTYFLSVLKLDQAERQAVIRLDPKVP